MSLSFGVAQEFGGRCNLRFDDTNPETENPEFVEAIERDVRWLGFEPSSVRVASDYVEDFYRLALELGLGGAQPPRQRRAGD